MTSRAFILFIDESVQDYQKLLASISPDMKGHVLSARRDGVEQITEILEQYYADSTIQEIHIVSHGAPGCLYLGSAVLGLYSLSQYAQQLQSWFTSSAHPSLFPSLALYGCNVAAGNVGEVFVAELQCVTGSRVYASKTELGSAELGGNWTIDTTTKNTTAYKQEAVGRQLSLFFKRFFGACGVLALQQQSLSFQQFNDSSAPFLTRLITVFRNV